MSARVPLTELLTGPGATSAAEDELLTAVEMPLPPDGSGSCYARLEYRRQMEIAVVGATAAVTLAGGTVEQARLAITALAPTIRLVPEAEEALVGSDAGARSGRRRQRRPRLRAAEPISDVRASGRLPARDGGGARATRDRRPPWRAPAARRSRSRPARPSSERRRMKIPVTLNVNGIAYELEVDPSTTLLSAVRDAVGLTGAKEGCDDSECGACMMLLDGKPVNACSYLALQADGREVTTVEGLADGGEPRPAPARVPGARRRAVRVLHAGHADLGDGPAARRTRARARTRSGSRSRATSAAAPATTAS